MAEAVIEGGAAAAAADTGAAAGAGGAAAGTPAAGAAAAAGSSPAAGAAAAGAAAASQAGAEGAQTPEQIKAAADAEAARVAALTPAQKAVEDKAKADATAAAAAPADYSKLTMPEGYKVDPKDAVFGEAIKIFGDNKIAPDVAQKLLDFTVTRDKALAQAINDNNALQWKKQSDDWKTATEKKFSAEDLGAAKATLAKVFDKDTAAYLDGLKFTNHPGFVEAMVKISKAISDDTWVTGNAANGAARTAQALYPKSNMNP